MSPLKGFLQKWCTVVWALLSTLFLCLSSSWKLSLIRIWRIQLCGPSYGNINPSSLFSLLNVWKMISILQSFLPVMHFGLCFAKTETFCLFIFLWSVRICLRLSVSVTLLLSFCLFVCLYACLSVSEFVFVSVYLSVSLSVSLKWSESVCGMIINQRHGYSTSQKKFAVRRQSAADRQLP